jgi:hypothetical protein
MKSHVVCQDSFYVVTVEFSFVEEIALPKVVFVGASKFLMDSIRLLFSCRYFNSGPLQNGAGMMSQCSTSSSSIIANHGPTCQ